jgi:hypothetical protein
MNPPVGAAWSLTAVSCCIEQLPGQRQLTDVRRRDAPGTGIAHRPAVPRFVSVFCGLLLSGCVTVYQPLVGLQRPVALDLQQPNFTGLKVLFRCFDGDSQADVVCARARTLFRNQGASVATELPRLASPRTQALSAEKPDLIVEVRARKLAEESAFLLWVACIMTATLVPAVVDATFAQDITVRDGEGFLLGQETWQARFVNYVGLGALAVTGLGDWLLRPKSEQVGGQVAQQDFSRDFYSQLSQLVFNARMRQSVMRAFDPPTPASPGAAP